MPPQPVERGAVEVDMLERLPPRDSSHRREAPALDGRPVRCARSRRRPAGRRRVEIGQRLRTSDRYNAAVEYGAGDPRQFRFVDLPARLAFALERLTDRADLAPYPILEKRAVRVS